MASLNAKTSSPVVFERTTVRRQRARAAAGFRNYTSLRDEADAFLLERLDDIRRPFPRVLNLGACPGVLTTGLVHKTRVPESLLVSSNMSASLLEGEGFTVAGDEEFLPFAANSFDLVITSLALHWVNDLPGALIQIKNTLRPGGAFLAAIIGGNSLQELRTCLMEGELHVTGGVSPRVSPTVDLLTLSGLMQRAGFGVPVVDQENITMLYPDMGMLMHDLRGMGEANANSQRVRHFSRRAIFSEAERIYRERFSDPSGKLAATFQILFLHGWKE